MSAALPYLVLMLALVWIGGAASLPRLREPQRPKMLAILVVSGVLLVGLMTRVLGPIPALVALAPGAWLLLRRPYNTHHVNTHHVGE